MQFLRENQAQAVAAITKCIGDGISGGKRVLWLVSGGSNITAEVEIMKQLQQRVGDKLAALAVLPMDERFGKPGHAESNVQKLREAGFEPGEATLVDVLMHDLSYEQTCSFYNDVAAEALASAGLIVGQFGIGTDAHIAGIFPDSPPLQATTETVVAYEWPDFTRLTLTPTALRRIETAFVLAYGESKKSYLERLQQNTEPLEKLPAKLLYDLPAAYVYNDVIETPQKEG